MLPARQQGMWQSPALLYTRLVVAAGNCPGLALLALDAPSVQMGLGASDPPQLRVSVRIQRVSCSTKTSLAIQGLCRTT